MNVIKTVLIIGAIFGLLAFATAPAMAQFDKVWVGGGGPSWHVGSNWNPSGAPQAGDTVQIGDGQVGFTVVISTADAACKTLEITGKTLTLGDANADTTSTLHSNLQNPDAIIRFVKGGSGAAGVLNLLRWVTFAGGGSIEAPANANLGVIKRNNSLNDQGMIIPAGAGNELTVVGNINILSDFDHRNTETNTFVGTRAGGQVMTFGRAGGGPQPERVPDIKGAGTIKARNGTVRFTVVDFDDATAPARRIYDGTINLTADGGPSDYLGEVFNIDMVLGSGTLDLDNNLVITGTFTVSPGRGNEHTVELALSKVFEVGAIIAR